MEILDREIFFESSRGQRPPRPELQGAKGKIRALRGKRGLAGSWRARAIRVFALRPP